MDPRANGVTPTAQPGSLAEHHSSRPAPRDDRHFMIISRAMILAVELLVTAAKVSTSSATPAREPEPKTEAQPE
jgi:hypothetical protein